MRIEAVQNERRPYGSKRDLMDNKITNQRIRKQSENKVKLKKKENQYL